MLELNNICVRKQSKVILDNASLTVKEGSVTVLLGRNGSGKSTLLDSVIGQTKYAGEILLDGIDLRRISPRERAKKLVCLPQKLADSGMSVASLVSLGRSASCGPFYVPDAEDRDAVAKAIETVGLDGKNDRPLNTLSGGERQKAYIAMVLASDAKYLLFDEPTTHLDIGATREICTLISSLSRGLGRTVLAVLHDLNSALEIADQVCVLDCGRVVFSGTAESFSASDVPYDIFGARRICAEGKTVFI